MLGWSEKFTKFHIPRDLGPAAGAKLDEWSAAANQLFAAGCEAQAFALLASFAALLMALFPTVEGGAIVSIVGGRKSGKSVAMTAAGTVWGKPDELALRWRYRFEMLTGLRNLPVLTAALASMDPEIVGTFATHFIHPANWRTTLISFGGTSLRETLRPTASWSITEFAVHVPRGLIAPDKSTPSILECKLLDNRGTAGKAYLHHLCTKSMVAWCRKALASKYGALVDEFGNRAEYRFQMRAIAAAWVAGILCVEAKILEMSPDRIAKWAMEQALPKQEAAQ
jgi:hypothetical protein